MPSSAVYELAILLSLKDAASGGLDRFEDRLRATGKEGRAMLQTVQDLRKDLRQGLALAGVGVGTLAALKKGVDVAGDFEASMADLRLSIEETSRDGQVNLSKLGNEMDRFEQLGMRLGNALPGSTQDFIQMFAALKQGGLSTNSILEGTGEAVANLAVITHQLPKDLAEPFAQYVQQFQLTGKEAMQLSDTLGKLKFSTGLNPQDLIEGSKFFQLRVGSGLGYKGLEGAEQGGLFLASLKRYGLEGGLGGREAATFLQHMITHKDVLSDVKKEFGVAIELFDKKSGEFLGFDNLFKQMEKLRGLKTEARIQAFKALGGEEGAGVGTAIMTAGLEGWKKVNEEFQKQTSTQQKLNEITATYNAKWEAVQGTLSNLTATGLTPMLDVLKPILDLTNGVLGEFQEWAKTHPEIAKLAGTMAGITGIILAITGGIKAARAAWGLYRIASAAALGDTERQAAGLKTSLGGLGSLKLAVGLTIASLAVEKVVAQYMELQEVRVQQRKASKESLDLINRIAPSPTSNITIPSIPAQADEKKPVSMVRSPRSYELDAAGFNANATTIKPPQPPSVSLGRDMSPEAVRKRLRPENTWREQAQIAWWGLDSEHELEYATDRSTMPFLTRANPLRILPGLHPMESWTGGFDKTRVANALPRSLESAGVMSEFRKLLMELSTSGKITQETRANTEIALQLKYAQSFQQSSMMLISSWAELDRKSGLFGGALAVITSLAKQTGKEFNDVNASAKPLPGAFNQSTEAAKKFARDLSNIKLIVPFSGLLFGDKKDENAPSTTKTSALRSAIEGNRAGDALRAAIASSSSRGGGVRDIHINVAVPEGSPAAKDLEALANLIQSKVKDTFVNNLWDNAREVERIAVRKFDDGRARA